MDVPTPSERLARADCPDKRVAALLTIVRAGRLEYLLATDPARLPDQLPADTDSASLTLIELAAFDADAQLVLAHFAEVGWFDLAAVVARVPGSRRADRRRRAREVGQ